MTQNMTFWQAIAINCFTWSKQWPSEASMTPLSNLLQHRLYSVIQQNPSVRFLGRGQRATGGFFPGGESEKCCLAWFYGGLLGLLIEEKCLKGAWMRLWVRLILSIWICITMAKRRFQFAGFILDSVSKASPPSPRKHLDDPLVHHDDGLLCKHLEAQIASSLRGCKVRRQPCLFVWGRLAIGWLVGWWLVLLCLCRSVVSFGRGWVCVYMYLFRLVLLFTFFPWFSSSKCGGVQRRFGDATWQLKNVEEEIVQTTSNNRHNDFSFFSKAMFVFAQRGKTNTSYAGHRLNHYTDK